MQDVVTVKGWRNGLLITLPAANGWDDLRAALDSKLDEARTRAFWRGAQTTLDFGAYESGSQSDDEAQFADLIHHLRGTYDLVPVAVVTADEATRRFAQNLDLVVHEVLPSVGTSAPPSASARTPAPADVPPPSNNENEKRRAPVVAAVAAESSLSAMSSPEPATGANALYVPGTVRSGQRIVYFAGSVVVGGDVNAGAEIVAGGDVVVFGTLRGLAHAGAGASASGGNESARILAGLLKAQQIRIAGKIARAPEEDGSAQKKHDKAAAVAPGTARLAEVARIENGEIQIFPY